MCDMLKILRQPDSFWRYWDTFAEGTFANRNFAFHWMNKNSPSWGPSGCLNDAILIPLFLCTLGSVTFLLLTYLSLWFWLEPTSKSSAGLVEAQIASMEFWVHLNRSEVQEFTFLTSSQVMPMQTLSTIILSRLNWNHFWLFHMVLIYLLFYAHRIH